MNYTFNLNTAYISYYKNNLYNNQDSYSLYYNSSQINQCPIVYMLNDTFQSWHFHERIYLLKYGTTNGKYRLTSAQSLYSNTFLYLFIGVSNDTKSTALQLYINYPRTTVFEFTSSILSLNTWYDIDLILFENTISYYLNSKLISTKNLDSSYANSLRNIYVLSVGGGWCGDYSAYFDNIFFINNSTLYSQHLENIIYKEN